ncbi:MAG TPA: thiamine ABC transporter substrate-binding protein, partial [Ilumatobacteraceae bacterium]|nr:thiamine ABC transporter substrate-binding protein [Ilumatobacteraceae bacterium]
MNRGSATWLALAVLPLVAVACGDDDDASGGVTMVVYDSYPDDSADAPNPLQVALDEFTADTGIEVALVKSQDAGTMLSKAILTAGNPEGDVMWGVDNTLLSRAIEERVFDEYESPAVADLDPRFTTLVPDGEATPVDYGDVCVNFDIAALKAAGLAPPTAFEQLAQPEYASKLVVENAGTSSPGLAFLLASIAEFGEDGWEAFWTQLHDNGVQVVDGWNEAYYTSFTRAGGDRPLVVSYGSSPPFEVLYATEPMTEAPT